MYSRDSGDGAAGADARDQDVDLAIGVVPNLRPGGLEVNLGIGRIVELLRDEAIGRLGQDFLRLGDCALHALGAGSQDEFRSEGAQQNAALGAHGLRHHDDQLVAFHRRDEGQPDAGVAAGGLDQHGLAGMDLAGFFGFVIMLTPMRSLTLAQGLKLSSLATMSGADALGHSVEAHQRGVADEFGYVIGNLHERSPCS